MVQSMVVGTIAAIVIGALIFIVLLKRRTNKLYYLNEKTAIRVVKILAVDSVLHEGWLIYLYADLRNDQQIYFSPVRPVHKVGSKDAVYAYIRDFEIKSGKKFNKVSTDHDTFGSSIGFVREDQKSYLNRFPVSKAESVGENAPTF